MSDEDSYAVAIREHRLKKPHSDSNRTIFSRVARRYLMQAVLGAYTQEQTTYSAASLRRLAKRAIVAGDERFGNPAEDWDAKADYWKAGSNSERSFELDSIAHLLEAIASKPKAIEMLNARPKRRPTMDTRNHLAAIHLGLSLARGMAEKAAKREVRTRWKIDAKTLKSRYWGAFREGIDHSIWMAMNTQPGRNAPGEWIDHELALCADWLEAASKIGPSNLTIQNVREKRSEVYRPRKKQSKVRNK